MTFPRRPVVVLPYDRSEDSRAAIDRVAVLVPDAELTVLTVWEPAPGAPASEAAARRDAASTRATVGARHAAAAGIRARPLVRPGPSGVVEAIVAVAEDLDADLVVMGRHGRSGRHYRELGETVRGVLEHTGRTVVVVSGHDVPRADRAEGGGSASTGHGGAHVGAWVPRSVEDEQDGAG